MSSSPGMCSGAKKFRRRKNNFHRENNLGSFTVCWFGSVNLRCVDATNQSDVSQPDFEAVSKDGASNPNLPAASTWKSVFNLATEPRWQLAQRIVASRSFAKSALLSRFLLYVCEREITGRTTEISEHQIGVHVFGRRPGYHPGEDNIVRNYARQLRHRLDQYFLEEGRGEELRLSIPRGKYVPVYSLNHFQERPLLVVTEAETDTGGVLETLTPAAPAAVSVQPARRGRWLVAGLGFLLLLAGLAIAWALGHRASAHSEDLSHPLWAQLFDESHQTLIVPSDDGIVMIQNLTGHLVPLSEYINRDYLSLKSPYNIDEQNMKDLDAQRYTNVTDLNAVMRFSHLPEANDGQLTVRYARELHMEDLKDANVILLGSSFSNPWAELFEKTLNFEFEYQPHPNASQIVNRHPQAGELPVYKNDATGPSHRTYALIGFVPNLKNTGWILLVEGLTMAGTQAAADTLFNRDVMGPVLSQFGNADGSLSPFEILIETRSFGSDSPQASIVATRVHKKHS
jgi:hypothetical protein